MTDARLLPFCVRVAHSGVWETELTENAEAFVRACGATLNRRVLGKVDLKELRHLSHDGDALEDTIVQGTVATTNVLKIGTWSEVVNADGSTMRVLARWDGDVWVEVDDCGLMETRRWMEKTSMIVARTVSEKDGQLVTLKQYFRRFVKSANAMPEARLAAASSAERTMPQLESVRATAAKEKGEGSEDGSIFDQARDVVEGFGAKMFSGLGFGGGSPKKEEANDKEKEKTGVAMLSKLFDAARVTEILSTFECSFMTPTTKASAQATRGEKGMFYVTQTAFAFVSEKKNVTWWADALDVQELTVAGPSAISLVTSDSTQITLNSMKNRDESFDAMIAMLESMPSGDEPSRAMDMRPSGPPLCVGYEAESYVFLHVVDVTVEGAASKMSGTPLTTVSLAENKHTLNSSKPIPSGYGGICASVGKTVAFPLSGLNEFDGEHVSFLVSGDHNDPVGEAMLPVAALPKDEEGRALVRSAPFVVHLSVPNAKVNAGATGLRTKPLTKNAARGIGSVNVAAWIGSASEAIGLGVKKDGAEGTVSTKATVRSTPASCTITIVARSVRGLSVDSAEPVRCAITYGSQSAETSAVAFSTTEDMTFSFSEVSFNAEAPASGMIRIDAITSGGSEIVGSTTLDVAQLPRRRTDRNGNVCDPPRGRYHPLFTEDEGDEHEAGFVFLEAYVDDAITYATQEKSLIGDLSVKVLALRGLPEGSVAALIANMGDAWCLLPGFGGGGPSGWKREICAAVRDPADVCTLGIYDSNKGSRMLGKMKFSPLSLPEHGRPIICTVPLTTRDVFGSGEDNGEATIRLQFTQKVSDAALLLRYCTPMMPRHAYRFGDMDDMCRDLDFVKYEHLVTGTDALPEPLVRSILEVNDADTSVSTTRRTKASAMRLASTLEAFGDVLKPFNQAVTWEKPLYTAALHISIFMCLWFPRLIFVGYFSFVAAHLALRNTPRVFTVLGENKSKLVGSVDVARAPAGSTLSPLSSLVRESAGVQPRATPSNDAYDAIVQIAFWCQAQVEYMREPLERFSAILTWEDESDSGSFQFTCLGLAVFFFFIPFRYVAAGLIFVSLRHPWVQKPPVPSYKLAMARAIAPPPAA